MRFLLIIWVFCAIAFVSEQAPAQSLRVIDVQPGSRGSSPVGLVTMDGKLYFLARTDVADSTPEIWVYDPDTDTASLAGLLPDMQAGSSLAQSAAAVDGKIYFSAMSQGEPGHSVFSFDPATEEPTRIFHNPKEARGILLPRDFVVWNGLLFFSAIDEDASQWRYWAHYPDLVQTVELGDNQIKAGTPLVPALGLLYFGGTFYRPEGGFRSTELFALNPPSDVSIAVDSLAGPGPRWITRPETNFLYFHADKAGGPDRVWWSYHIPTQTAEIVRGSDLGGTDYLGHNAIAANGRVYTWYVPSNGTAELWALNATLGAYRVTTLPGRLHPFKKLTYFDGALYFILNDGTTGGELWRTVGEDGVEMVADINPHNNTAADPGSNPNQLTELDGRLYFVATDGYGSDAVHGTELWVYDPDAVDTAIEEHPVLSGGLRLDSPYPNPARANITATVRSVRMQYVEVALYDVLGRHVADLFAGHIPADGLQRLEIEGAALPGGIYFLRASSGRGTATRQVTLAK